MSNMAISPNKTEPFFGPYPQRTIHLENEYDMKEKTWNLKNDLKVSNSKFRKVRNSTAKIKFFFLSNMVNGVNQTVIARDIILLRMI